MSARAHLARAAGAWSRARRAGRRPTSSITGCAAPVRCARYSVWPEKCDAGVVDEPLVHGRRDHRVEAAAGAAVDRGIEEPEHVRGVAPVEPAGARGLAQAAGAALRCGGERARPASNGRPRRPPNQRRVADHDQPRGPAAPASARQISGPMPAGSPLVIAIVGTGARALTCGIRRRPRRAGGAARARFLRRRAPRASARSSGCGSRRRWRRRCAGRAAARCASRTASGTAG